MICNRCGEPYTPNRYAELSLLCWECEQDEEAEQGKCRECGAECEWDDDRGYCLACLKAQEECETEGT